MQVALLLLSLVLVPACGVASRGADDGAISDKHETEASTTPDAMILQKIKMAAVTKTAKAAKTTATASEEADEARFTHRAGPENIVDNSTYIDDPLTNGNPNAFI